MFKLKYLLVVPLLWISCKSTSEFTGFSYDPPGVTNTTDKVTEPQKIRVIGAGEPKVWISNEFEGARYNDFYQTGEGKFEVYIKPENAPINNSPWFAFEIWSDSTRTVELTLNYESARHRYEPKLWEQDSSGVRTGRIEEVTYDSATASAVFSLEVSPDVKRITAHYPDNILFSDLQQQIDSLNTDLITVDTAGYSVQDRPVYQLIVDETTVTDKGALILLSRQHPPEVSGYRVYQAFFDEITGDSEIARLFRDRFVIYAFPIINPDGVVNGHWRHNVSGIDLNRDWVNFNQPETRAVRDALLPLKERDDLTVFYGIDFHSTNENIFYPINMEITTYPDNLTQRWAEIVTMNNPELNFRSEEFDTSSPISKNWIYRTFGADAVTFEVDDELSREQTDRLGSSAARCLMELLTEEWAYRGNN